MSQGRPTQPAAVIRRWTTVWGAGLIALLVGTFLPWLYSGRIAKNSYQLADVSRRRLDAPGWFDSLLAVWPFLGPLWAVVVVVLILRRQRIAAIAAMVLATVTLLLSLTGLMLAIRVSSAYINGGYPGPLTTAVGAVLVLVSSVGLTRTR